MERIIHKDGDILGGFVFVKDIESRNKRRFVVAKCLSCGRDVEIRLHAISSGESKSCGCQHAAKVRDANTKHGMYDKPLYKVHSAMKSRCNNINNPNYDRYGGRGISVCDEWNDFISFMNWAKANNYKKGLVIDRIDNNNGYNPGNCHFVTQAENMRNTCNSVIWVTPKGEFSSLSLAKLAYQKDIGTRFSSKNYPDFYSRKKYEK